MTLSPAWEQCNQGFQLYTTAVSLGETALPQEPAKVIHYRPRSITIIERIFHAFPDPAADGGFADGRLCLC